MVSIAVPSWTQRASLKNSLGVRHRKNYKEHKRRNVMMLEEVRPTQKNAALTTHITQFCFHENFTRDEEARKGETNDNFRDGVGPLGIIKYQIPSDPPVGQEAPRTLSKVLGRNRDLLNPDSLAWPLY